MDNESSLTSSLLLAGLILVILANLVWRMRRRRWQWVTNLHESAFGAFRSECVFPIIVKGPPRATSTNSVDNLRRLGMIGVYKPLDAVVTTQETERQTSRDSIDNRSYQGHAGATDDE